jgi:hypothetical protein
MTMRVLSPILAALLAGACGAGPRPSPTPGAATGPIDSQRPLPSPLPEIAARVNGQPILLLRVALVARREQAKAADRSVPSAPALRQALQQLLVRELLLQEALARGVQADARAVERAYDAERARYLDELEWHLFLERQGLTADDFRAELRARALIDELQRRVVADIDPGAFSDDETRAFYEAHPELSPTQPTAPYEQAEETARRALAQTRSRERLDELVRSLEARAKIDVYL